MDTKGRRPQRPKAAPEIEAPVEVHRPRLRSETRPPLTEPSVPSESPAWLWPGIRQVAQLLLVDAGWLSKRRLSSERCGQERHVAPTLVLELADEYRRRDPGEVGAALIEHGRTRARSREELEQLEKDVERYFATTRAGERGAMKEDWWLAEAKRRLAADLYRQVVAATRGESRISSFEGVRFDDGAAF
jgi:hypothetical protein